MVLLQKNRKKSINRAIKVAPNPAMPLVLIKEAGKSRTSCFQAYFGWWDPPSNQTIFFVWQLNLWEPFFPSIVVQREHPLKCLFLSKNSSRTRRVCSLEKPLGKTKRFYKSFIRFCLWAPFLLQCNTVTSTCDKDTQSIRNVRDGTLTGPF